MCQEMKPRFRCRFVHRLRYPRSIILAVTPPPSFNITMIFVGLISRGLDAVRELRQSGSYAASRSPAPTLRPGRSFDEFRERFAL